MNEEAPWWQTGVIYHVYLRSFQDDDGDGVGDLRGLTRRLPYLRGLGVDAVWVSPFYDSPMRDFGYDVRDHTAIDPLFGSLDDFDRMVEEAHRLGLRVVVDWIPNHTSSDHSWFEASRDPASPFRAFYCWRETPGDEPPNNWPSAFGGPAWTRDAASGAWYLHLCLPEMPDLDWHNPAVEAAQFDVARFWLNRGVDGFRVDVAHWIGKHPDLPDNPPADAPAFVNLAKPPSDFDRVAHVHDMDGPLAHDVYRRFRRLLDGYDPPRMAMGEIHLGDLDRWAAYYGHDDELHLPCYFRLLSVPFEAEPLADAIRAQEAVLPPGAWPTYVLGNHDEPRLASRVGPDRARLAAVLLLTLRGTPTLYYGDELGLHEAHIPPEKQQDPWAKNEPELGRDGCRTPMPWSDAPNAGFSDAEPWLPLNPDFPTRNVAHALEDGGSMLNLYRRLLRLRRDHPALHRGDYAAVDGVPEGCFVYHRTHGGERLLVALNLTESPQEVSVNAASLLCSTREGEAHPGHLRPLEGQVLRLVS